MIHFQVRHLMGVLECHQLIAVPITAGKKRYSRLSVVTPFQLWPEKKIQSSGHHSMRRSNCHCCAVPITTGKKDTVFCPLLRHSNYDRKKKRYSRLPIIRCAVPIAIVCCAVPITTEKKRYSRLSVVTPFQLRPEKKDTFVWPSLVAPFRFPLLRRSNYDRKKKIQSSVRCYAVPNTTGKKNRGKYYFWEEELHYLS